MPNHPFNIPENWSDSQSALGCMEKWRERKEALPEYEKVWNDTRLRTCFPEGDVWRGCSSSRVAAFGLDHTIYLARQRFLRLPLCALVPVALKETLCVF